MSAFSPKPHAFARFARWLVRVAFGAAFRMRLEGIPPHHGPYLLVANHQGWADPFVLIALFPGEPRLHFFGDRQAVRSHWWKRAVIRALGGIVLVDRTHALDRSAINGALDVLATGAPLVLFAEGRVSRREAELAPFERGTGYLALKARVPVLPVWLRGTAELYLGRELTVRVGALRPPPDVPVSREATDTFTRAVHTDVAALATPWVEPVGVRRRWRWLTDVL